MTTPINFNGNAYRIPVVGDVNNWGPGLTTYLAALAAGAGALNAANVWTLAQTFDLGLALVPQTAPAQAANVQVYAGTDGNLYAIAATGNSGVPVQLTPGGGSGGGGSYVNKTANYQLLLSDSGNHFTTRTASGSVTFTLPASPVFGDVFAFTCSAAQDLIVAGGTFNGPGSLSGTSLTIHGASAGSRYTTCKVAYDGAVWMIEYVFGTAFVA